MSDILTPDQRKFNMSRIRSKNTSPELIIRKLLYSNRIRGYRIHYNLPGKPDIVFVRKKIALFIDGCFWHKCPLCFQEPATHKDFWMKKIESNVQRDRIINQKLKEEGWIVLRFWEHDIRKNPELVIEVIKSHLNRTDN